MKHLSPSLLVLAALAAAPASQALDVKDDDVKLGLTLQIQVRAEAAQAEDSTGRTFGVAENAAAPVGQDPVDFYLRRARIGFKGSWKSDYKFAFQLRSDNQDRAGSANPGDGSNPAAPSTRNRLFQTHVAFIERVFKQEDLKLEHSLRAGLDYAFFNGSGSSAVFSSSGFLLPAARATDSQLAPRGVGVGYKLAHEIVTWGVDVQNNTNDDNLGKGDGMFYGTRLHLTLPGELAIAKPVESFLGKEGTGVLLSLEYGKNVNANTVPAAPAAPTSTDTVAMGSELLVHVDGLTALAEIRDVTATVTSLATNVETETKRRIWLVQAGYALPLYDTVIEPAVRYTEIDLNTDNGNETGNFGNGDYAAVSGTQIEAGVNWYLHGHNNKLQLAYLTWEAEAAPAGQGKPSADIYRAQWQLSF